MQGLESRLCGATVAVAQVATKAGAKVATKAGAKVATKAATKAATKSETKAGSKVASKGATRVATKAATKAGAKAASLAAAMMLMAVMSLMLAACGGSGAGGSGAAGSTQGGAAGSDGGSGVADGTGAGTGQTGAGAGASGAPIRLVNGKIEIDAQLKAYAKDYQERTGQEVIIESLGGGVNILAQIKNYHAAGNTPDIFVTNVNEREQLADLYLDLSDQPWVAETDAYLTDTDGKVIGAPFSVEGIGLVYNADILAKAGIDPNTLINIGAQRAAFEKLDAMKGELGLSAVVSAAAESGQMYWATGNHLMSAYLSMGMARDDKTLVDMMNRGEIDEARMGQFADYVKLLFEYADPAVLLSGTYDDQLALFAQGKTAFLCQGNWVDPSLETYGVTFGCGILPYAFLETDTPGATADSPTWWAVYRGGANIDAAKAFLTDILLSDAGQKMFVEECGAISAYKNCPYAPTTPVSADLFERMKVGPTYAWDWAMQPEGIPQNATGQIFELYAKDQIGKEQFVQMMAAAVADYVAQ